MVNINDKQGIRKSAHVFNPAYTLFEFFHITGKHQCFFFGQLFKSAVSRLYLQLFQAFDGSPDGFVIGQHAAQPALVNIRHSGTTGLFLDDFAGSTFGADKKNFLTPLCHLLDLAKCLVEGRNGMFKINDMDFVTGAENKGFHFRVPVATLMAEMNTGLQHVFHASSSHNFSFGLGLHISHTPNFVSKPAKHPGICVDICVTLIIYVYFRLRPEIERLYTIKPC